MSYFLPAKKPFALQNSPKSFGKNLRREWRLNGTFKFKVK